MAKSFKKGIDNVFSPTKKVEKVEVVEVEDKTGDNKDTKVNTEIEAVREEAPVVNKVEQKVKRVEYVEKSLEQVGYNLKYPKELQRRIKLFCLENDGIDMRDVFIEGAKMYMSSFK